MADVGLIIVGVAEIVITVVVAWLSVKHHEVNSLKAEIKKNAADIVKAELAMHTTPLKVSIDALAGQIARVEKRLESGESEFEKLDSRDQASELKVERVLGELKVYLANTFSTKIDVEKHQASVDRKFDSIVQKQSDMASDLAVLANVSKHHG